MAKARPKIPGKKAGDPGDSNPDPYNPRPSERNKVFKEIGKEIVKEWRRVLGSGGQMDRTTLEREIGKKLRLSSTNADPTDGDPMGQVEIGVIVDPKPEAERKFVWIVIPYPEYPANLTTDAEKREWLDNYDNTDLGALLGEAVLFGCGR